MKQPVKEELAIVGIYAAIVVFILGGCWLFGGCGPTVMP